MFQEKDQFLLIAGLDCHTCPGGWCQGIQTEGWVGSARFGNLAELKKKDDFS